ncbi:MAG: hypothetical protein WCG82_11140 [Bacteroidota bacterium]
MLFDFQENTIESEKERNFYFKFFAGYYFNELVPGTDSRIQDFCKLLNSSPYLFNDPDFGIELSLGSTHVTFDLHAYLFDRQTDRGELADIFIVDQVKSVCIAIEAKWLEDWDYEKDIISNNGRIQKLKEIGHFKNVYQCLLIKRSKLENGKKKEKKTGSNYSRLFDKKDIPIILITWECLLENIDEPAVRNFYKHYIEMSKADFRKGLKF